MTRAPAAEALEERHAELLSRIREILGEPERLRAGDRIHDLRVATKKLRALHRMLGGLPGAGRLEPLSRITRKIARRASNLRDLQVHIGLVLESCAGGTSTLVPWLDELFQRERRTARQLGRRAPKLARRIAKRTRLFAKTVSGVEADLLRRVATRYCRMVRDRVIDDLRRQRDESELHGIRKRTKRWIHAEELRGSVFGGPPTSETKLGRRLASALGRWHDAVRASEILDERIHSGTEAEEDASLVSTLGALRRGFEAERERRLDEVRAASEAVLAGANAARTKARAVPPSRSRKSPAGRRRTGRQRR